MFTLFWTESPADGRTAHFGMPHTFQKFHTECQYDTFRSRQIFFFQTSALQQHASTNHSSRAGHASRASPTATTSTTVASQLILCASHHQAAFGKQDANVKSHNLEENIRQSITDQLG